MRIVSLVPSWTETLLIGGCEVVGRTRYCIHPEGAVADIPAIGGTKDWDWEQVKALKPDLIVLDKEENPKFMGEQTEIPYFASHVASVRDVPLELERLAGITRAKRLEELSTRWRAVIARGPRPNWDGMSDFPGLLEWGRRPDQPVQSIEYVIWKKPWMAVSKDTFIGSVLEFCGFGPFLKQHMKKYPEIELNGSKQELLLFSSEPFPFAKVFKSLDQIGSPFSLVNGESFSWFGIRSLEFLERVHGNHSP